MTGPCNLTSAPAVPSPSASNRSTGLPGIRSGRCGCRVVKGASRPEVKQLAPDLLAPVASSVWSEREVGAGLLGRGDLSEMEDPLELLLDMVALLKVGHRVSRSATTVPTHFPTLAVVHPG